MSKINSGVAGAASGAAIGSVVPGIGTAIGAIGGGILGFLGGKDDNSGEMLRQQMEAASKIPLPVLKEYYPELYQKVVQINPEIETATNLGPSEMQGISTDPGLRQAQLNALNKLSSIGEAGGRDAQFMADQSRLESDINSNTQGQVGAIQQNMATRGLSGGMSEMVARNQAAQAGANRQAQMGMDQKAQADQRALQALMQSGQLGGQMQSQDFNQQSAKAQASDSISRFNAQNMQNVNSANVQARNNAQLQNANNAQKTADQNVGAKNSAQQYNTGLQQQQFDNQMKKVGMVNTASTGMANASQNEAQNQDKFLGGLASSAATAYAANKKK